MKSLEDRARELVTILGMATDYVGPAEDYILSALREVRAETTEACAVVADNYDLGGTRSTADKTARKIAADIRALASREEPPDEKA